MLLLLLAALCGGLLLVGLRLDRRGRVGRRGGHDAGSAMSGTDAGVSHGQRIGEWGGAA